MVKKYVLVWPVWYWRILYYTKISETTSTPIQVETVERKKILLLYFTIGIQFRGSLTNKKCKTIEVCIAEGKFAGMFGWSLTHTPIGGFLGLPGTTQVLSGTTFRLCEIQYS